LRNQFSRTWKRKRTNNKVNRNPAEIKRVMMYRAINYRKPENHLWGHKLDLGLNQVFSIIIKVKGKQRQWQLPKVKAWGPGKGTPKPTRQAGAEAAITLVILWKLPTSKGRPQTHTKVVYQMGNATKGQQQASKEWCTRKTHQMEIQMGHSLGG
jgi:hypothetical protein